MNRSGCLAVAFGLAGVLAVGSTLERRDEGRDEGAGELEVVRDDVAALAGVWWKHEPGVTGDPLRFYYFHGDGTGLYRYGQVGHAYTHSFDYDVDGGQLHLRFRKTGASHEVRFSVRPGTNGHRDFLVLHDDPRESDATEYFRENERPRPRLSGALLGDPTLRADFGATLERSAELGPAPAGHMWIDLQRYATGGQGFFFYQFRPVGVDARGVGWFHRGDFDDWSTESFSYRIVDADGPRPRLELHFDIAGTTEVTGFSIGSIDSIGGTGNARAMTVREDPRDFGQTHVYRDAGRSFGSIAALDAAGVDPRLAPVVTFAGR